MLDNIIKQQLTISKETINLIPSENIISDKVKEAYSKDFFNRYYFGKVEGLDIFPGREKLSYIEQETINLLKKLLKTDYIDISSISGINCMQTVLYAFTNRGDSVFTISKSDGGHHITKEILIKLGCNVKYIPFLNKGFKIDYKKFSQELKDDGNCSLIYVDQMTGIYPISLLKLAKYIDTSNIIKYYDVSHPFAFILSGEHKNPIDSGFDAFGGSTHKTIPGPHKGIFTTNNKNLYKKIINESEITVSHKHYSDILGLGLLLEEMNGKWFNYTHNITNNLNLFASKLDKKLYKIHCEDDCYSKSHQLLLFVNNGKLFEVFDKLKQIGIFVNILPIPFSGNLGLRLGFQEITYIGFKKEFIDKLVFLFNCILEKDILYLKSEVKFLRAKYE